jgi:hypothetical protein
MVRPSRRGVPAGRSAADSPTPHDAREGGGCGATEPMHPAATSKSFLLMPVSPTGEAFRQTIARARASRRSTGGEAIRRLVDIALQQQAIAEAQS